jgi:hypothetical protein
VPVIAVFTKYEQFMRNVEMQLEDEQRDPALLDDEAEKMFNEHYLAKFSVTPPFVRLEGERFVNRQVCLTLIFVLQKCTSLASSVPSFLKRRLTHSLATSLPSCCYRYRRIIWSLT